MAVDSSPAADGPAVTSGPSLPARVAALPVWFCLAVTLACLQLREFYPFSHFPMYSKIAPSTFCLYVTDGNDQVLHTLPEFGRLSSVLKKMFNVKIQKYKADGRVKRYQDMTEEQYQEVGAQILQTLVEERRRLGKPPLGGSLRLMHEEFVLRDDKVMRNEFKLAEIPAGTGS